VGSPVVDHDYIDTLTAGLPTAEVAMPFYVAVNGNEGTVAEDLLRIYQGLAFSGPIPAVGGQVIRVSYFQSAGAATVGEQLASTLINAPPGGGDIFVIGLTSDQQITKADGTVVALKTLAGFRLFNPSSANSKLIDALVGYDVLSCNFGGYVVFDASHACIDFNRDLILIHELAHCLYPQSDFTEEAREKLAVDVENAYRAERSLPLRVGIKGGCRSDAEAANECAGQSMQEAPSEAGPSNSFFGFNRCVIASATTGGPHSAEVNELRRLRDTVLLGTRWGRQFFSDFYQTYYEFAPPIAQRLANDDRARQTMRWALVDPLLMFFELAVSYPDVEAELQEADLQIDSLSKVATLLSRWISEIPTDIDIAGMSAEESCRELIFAFRFLWRTPALRRQHLTQLSFLKEIPLKSDRRALCALNRALAAVGASYGERSRIVGKDAAILRSTTSCGGCAPWARP